MKIRINPSTINGKLLAPASKSAMQRACALALLSNANTTILNPGFSNDDNAALDIIKKLGAEIKAQNKNQIIINSNGINPKNKEINCGESGLSIRMFTPIIALSKHKIIINGEGSLLNRPMDFFDEILPQLNVEINSNNGKLPLEIKGNLIPKEITIDGSLSSQFLTGLIFAYAVAEKNKEIKINVKNLKSKPYIDLSLDVLKKFGIIVNHKNYEEFIFYPNQKLNNTTTYKVEGDWSGAAFLLVAGAIGGKVAIENLDINSTQGDKKILEAIKNIGAKITYKETSIIVEKNFINSFDFDATDCPDLFPPLVALAINSNGISKIKGVNRLQHKESNRGLTLQQEFGKLGYKIDLENDIMLIHGNEKKCNGNIELLSHHDHRIAMACSLVSLNSKESIWINNAEAINKSYPNFYEDMKLLGMKIS